MDMYEEVAQQGQAHPLSPTYVPDPMEWDEHVLVYVPEPEHPEYHVPSDDDIQVKDQPYAEDASPTAESPGYHADSDSLEDDTDTDSIDYPDELGINDEDSERDDDEEPSEEHDPEEEDEPSKDFDETKPFEENEAAATLPPARRHGGRISVRPQPPMAASTQARIDEFAVGSPSFPLPPASRTYDQAPLGHRAAMIRMRDDIPEEDQPPQRRFVLTAPPPGCDIAESYAATARASRVADRAVDVRKQESEIFYTQLHDARTDRRDIRLDIDVVRDQRTGYETELHEVRQAYLSSEARNRALLARLKTLETHMSHMEWQR
ncbi:hypothetical protein Tco_0929784 [Tanacetum coccineum]